MMDLRLANTDANGCLRQMTEGRRNSRRGMGLSRRQRRASQTGREDLMGPDESALADLMAFLFNLPAAAALERQRLIRYSNVSLHRFCLATLNTRQTDNNKMSVGTHSARLSPRIVVRNNKPRLQECSQSPVCPGTEWLAEPPYAYSHSTSCAWTLCQGPKEGIGSGQRGPSPLKVTTLGSNEADVVITTIVKKNEIFSKRKSVGATTNGFLNNSKGCCCSTTEDSETMNTHQSFLNEAAEPGFFFDKEVVISKSKKAPIPIKGVLSFGTSVILLGGNEEFLSCYIYTFLSRHPIEQHDCGNCGSMEVAHPVEIQQLRGPPNRCGFAVAAGKGESMFLFGGIDNNGALLKDTWHFELSSKLWTLIDCGSVGPRPRIGHTLVSDKEGHLWLFGGRYAVVEMPKRAHHTTAVEERRASLNSHFFPLSDLWLFDGTKWSEIPLASGPCARYDHVSYLLKDQQKLLVHGGVRNREFDNISSGLMDDIWIIDLKTRCSYQITQPITRPRCCQHHLLLPCSENKFLMIGGTDELEATFKEAWLLYLSPQPPSEDCCDPGSLTDTGQEDHDPHQESNLQAFWLKFQAVAFRQSPCAFIGGFPLNMELRNHFAIGEEASAEWWNEFFVLYSSSELTLCTLDSPSCELLLDAMLRLARRVESLDAERFQLTEELSKCRQHLSNQIIKSSLSKAEAAVKKKQNCAVCFVAEVCIAFGPCGHMCCCESCAEQVLERMADKRCPVSLPGSYLLCLNCRGSQDEQFNCADTSAAQ